ncbi:hypothetical protein E2I00_011347, partial [Balaenoptera physalus]
QNLAIKGLYPKLCPGHKWGTISYNEGYVAKSPHIVLNTYPDKVSVDVGSALAIQTGKEEDKEGHKKLFIPAVKAWSWLIGQSDQPQSDRSSEIKQVAQMSFQNPEMSDYYVLGVISAYMLVMSTRLQHLEIRDCVHNADGHGYRILNCNTHYNRAKTVYEGFISAQFYSSLIEEIGTLGWDKLVYVDTCFSTIKLKAEDASGREHLITVKLKAKVINRIKVLNVEKSTADLLQRRRVETALVNLSYESIYVYTLTESSLISIHSQFLAALESLKAFWDVMDEIDEKTWVLEPEKPTRSATARRIALGNNASINIEVDPRHPTMLPECCFLGADHARAILEKSDFSMDCGICYAYQLDGAIPDQVCDNSRCGQPFHQICLY